MELTFGHLRKQSFEDQKEKEFNFIQYVNMYKEKKNLNNCMEKQTNKQKECISLYS